MLTCCQINRAINKGERILEQYQGDVSKLASYGVLSFYNFINKNSNDLGSPENDVLVLIQWFSAALAFEAASGSSYNAAAATALKAAEKTLAQLRIDRRGDCGGC